MSVLDISFVVIATEFLQAISKQVDPYTSNKGEIIVTNDNQVVLLTPSHIQFARYGRGPGKNPPLDNILAWVSSEKIIFDGLSEKGTAFAIQASIAKNGTKNWVQNAPNAMEQAINANSKQFNEKLNNTLIVELRNNLNKQLEKLYPPIMNL